MGISVKTAGAGGNSDIYKSTYSDREASADNKKTYRDRAAKNKPSSSDKQKKKLHYNYRQLAARVLQAKTSVSAGLAASFARSKIADLRKKYMTGAYDRSEIEHALIHAEKMERVAKKRMNRMAEEEHGKRSISASRAKAAGEKRRAARARAMREEIKKLEELKTAKKRRRVDENDEVLDANLKYLKAKYAQIEQEKSTQAGYSAMDSLEADSETLSGVTIELEGVETVAEAVDVADASSVDISV